MPGRIAAFVGGVCLLHASAALPPPAVLAVITAVVLAALHRLPVAAALLAGYVLGALAAHAALADRLPRELDGSDLTVTGVVASLPDRRQQGARFQFRPDPDLHPELPRTLRVSWYVDGEPPEAATRWQLTLRARAPRGTLNPASFDYEQWLVARRIGGTAAVREYPPPRPLDDARGELLLATRAYLDRAIAAALPDHPRRAIIRGLALGERGELDRDAWEVFARTGTAHLMAISGLHIGMVAAIGFGFGHGIARIVPVLADRRRETGVVTGLVVACAYAALAGFAVPTRRALCMLAAAGVALCLRRVGVTFSAWWLALAAVVALDPLSPLTIGFWLSFAAVACIAWRVANRRQAPSAPHQLVRAQWAVALGLLPLTLWFFQRGSLVAPVANLVAIPLFSVVVVPATLGASLIVAFDAAAGAPLLALVAAMLDAVWRGLEVLAAWPAAQRFTPRPPLASVVAACAGAMLILAPRGVPARALSGAALCLPMLCWQPAVPSYGGWRLTLLDVGQGLAAVVRTERHVLVYDAGPSYGPYADAGSRIVVPYLRAHGVEAVDMLVVSHPHDDHQGGVGALLDALPVRGVLAGDPGPLAASAERCVAGAVWHWDGVSFRVLHPGAVPARNANLDSCVIEVDGPGGRALLPGDIEWQTELALAQRDSALRPVDVVVAPHHGSATSSTPRFVFRTLPRRVFVPAGHGNRWRFPDARVVERWHSVGAESAVTGDAGAITIEADPVHGLGAPDFERLRRHAWWRAE